ncbi:hypothetical protein BURMUCF2_1356 [Burkholderia multivorans CF2]|nr:hypothetical protein BURMUCF2_1356 [Burkholderia multivorans CF2]
MSHVSSAAYAAEARRDAERCAVFGISMTASATRNRVDGRHADPIALIAQRIAGNPY